MWQAIGDILFLVSANMLAYRLGCAENKEATKSAWWSIGAFVAGVLVGVLHFCWIEI